MYYNRFQVLFLIPFISFALLQRTMSNKYPAILSYSISSLFTVGIIYFEKTLKN